MNNVDSPVRPRGGRMRIPRSRGAASGFLLILLGLWGALIPFVGPYFDFAFTPDQEWTWTTARGWLEVLPGAATVVGGLLLLASRNRATAMFGGWLTVLAGAWFVVGRAFAGPLGLGNAGTPVATTDTKRVWLELTYFYGLGALIIFLGALALGRLSVRSVRDVEYTQPPLDAAAHPQPVPVSHSATYEPVTHERVTHERVTHEPLTHERATQEPVTHQPTMHERVTDEPSMHEAARHERVTGEPATHERVRHERVTGEPATHERVTNQPVMDQPVTNQSVTTPSDQSVTTPSDQPRRRPWSGLFGRRHTRPVH